MDTLMVLKQLVDFGYTVMIFKQAGDVQVVVSNSNAKLNKLCISRGTLEEALLECLKEIAQTIEE